MPRDLQPRVAASGHIPALDGVRGIAIALVLLHHFFEPEPTIPGGRLVAAIAHAGWAGVDLFFVLSGFLITGILLDTKGSARYFRNFYARRALRIFPLYYAFVGGLVLLALVARDRGCLECPRMLDVQGWYWSYLVNVLAALRGWEALPLNTGALWSLAVEEQFYLVWPAVVLWMTPRRFTVLCWTILLAAPALRTATLLAGGGWVSVYVLTPLRMDALALGGLIAVLYRDPGGAIDRWRRWTPVISATALFVVVAVAVRAGALERKDFLVATVGYSALAALAGAIVLAGATKSEESRAGRFLTAGALTALGKYSYGIYIIHLPLMFIAAGAGLSPRALQPVIGSPMAAHVLFTIVMSGTSFLLALVSWHLYEKHWLALKKRFEKLPATPLPLAHRSSRQ